MRFGARIFPKVLCEIEGSHNAFHCLPRSVVYLPVLHLIVDSETFYYSLRLEQEITLSITL